MNKQGMFCKFNICRFERGAFKGNKCFIGYGMHFGMNSKVYWQF